MGGVHFPTEGLLCVTPIISRQIPLGFDLLGDFSLG
jgi:hypothetical protein